MGVKGDRNTSTHTVATTSPTSPTTSTTTSTHVCVVGEVGEAVATVCAEVAVIVWCALAGSPQPAPAVGQLTGYTHFPSRMEFSLILCSTM